MPRPVGYLAPFTPEGDLLHYVFPGAHTARPDRLGRIDWREVAPFEAKLTIDSMHSGRSAKYTEWTDPAGRRYPMFIADLIEMLRVVVIEHGTVTTTWCVRKRGENYGIRAVPGPDAAPKR